MNGDWIDGASKYKNLGFDFNVYDHTVITEQNLDKQWRGQTLTMNATADTWWVLDQAWAHKH